MKFKQYNLGTKFGGFRLMASRSMIYMSFYSLFVMSAAAIEQIGVWFPWVNFPILIIFAVLWFLFAMAMDHFFIYKAEIDYTTKQAYIDENPAAVAIKKIEKDVAEIKQILKERDNADTPRN